MVVHSRSAQRLALVIVAIVASVLGVASSARSAGTAPETSIYNYDIYYDNADFWFHSDVADATFQCRLDNEEFAACVSPVNYRALPQGTHTFEVRAVDSAGVVDATPDNLTFTSAPKPPPPPPAPDNDNWYGAQALSGTSGSVQGTNINATTQWDEPYNPNGSEHTVWYVWTAGRTANVTFAAVGDGFTPRVSIFTGSQTSNAFMSSSGVGSATTSTYAGLEYHIAVDGVGGGIGAFTLSWAYDATGPPNDYRAEAETISGEAGSLTASTVGATVEVNEPRHDGSAGENTNGHSIWYRWTAPAAGTAIFTTQGSSFDTLLRAYTESWGQLIGQGWYLPDLNPWTSWSRLELKVQPGETYLIAVDGEDGAYGDVQLSWRTALDSGETNAPTVEMWSPQPGAEVNGVVTFMSDASDDESVDRVVYRIAPNGSGAEPWFVGESQAPPYDVTLDTSVLAPGVYSVYATAYDPSGNSASHGFTITVGSVPPPTLKVPTAITAEATRPTGALVKWSATAIDYKGVQLAVSCAPKPGSLFPLGTTKVTCSTHDSYGNQVAKSFTVKVVDTTPPTLTLPAALVADAVAPTGGAVEYTATATDVVSGEVSPQCSPVSGSTFAIGDAIVTCSATDAAGNTGKASFGVHVKGADEQLADLHAVVESMALDSTLATRLLGQIDDARKQLAAGRTNAVCGGLTDFVSLAQKESGKRLTAEQVDRLFAAATRIRGVVAC
jgi:Bacterial Ig domain/HYR domain